MIKSKSDKQPLNIILLGDPAAGKATQSALLLKKFKLIDFDMGKELSKLRQKSRAFNAVLTRSTDKGKLTPTQWVRKIDQDMITKAPLAKGILFDGHPKMVGEAKLVASMLKKMKRRDPIVLYITIPQEETVKRMHDRRGYFRGKFGKRADDTDSALRNRVRYYRKNIAQVVTFFSEKYPYKKIDGLGSVAQVHKRVLKEIKKLENG